MVTYKYQLVAIKIPHIGGIETWVCFRPDPRRSLDVMIAPGALAEMGISPLNLYAELQSPWVPAQPDDKLQTV